MVEAFRSFNFIAGGAGVGATAFVGGGVFLPIVNSDGASVGGLGGAFINAAPGPSEGVVIYVPLPSGDGCSFDYIN